MKTLIHTLAITLLVGTAFGETDTLSSAVQKGLFEEEVNRDFRAAIDAYESAVERFDRDRQLAATALFRLAENYRRAGRTQEAEALYERVAREFHDQTELAERAIEHLPEERLNALGARTADVLDDEEEREIERLRRLLSDSPDVFYGGRGTGAPNPNEAIEKRHMRVLEFIVENGADITSIGRNGTPLHVAITQRFTPAVELLIREGVDVNATFNRRTPLYNAAAEGYLTGTQLLLQASADVDGRSGEHATERDFSNRVPLLAAASMNHIRLARLLIDHGADVNAANENGDTPFFVAVRSGHLEMAELLLSHGAEVDAVYAGRFRTDFGSDTTPLHWVVTYDFLELAEFLLEHGADVTARDDRGWTPLDYRLLGGRVRDFDNPMATLLREHGAEERAHAEIRLVATIPGPDGRPRTRTRNLYVVWDRSETKSLTAALKEADIPLEETETVRLSADESSPQEGREILLSEILSGQIEDIALEEGMVIYVPQ